MKSLSKVMKRPEEEVRPYDFFAGFKLEEKQEETEEEEAGEEEEPAPDLTAHEIRIHAEEQAKQILNDARDQAEFLREQAYREGREEGRDAGYRDAYEEQRKMLDEETRNFQRELTDVINSVSIEKDKILEQYIDELKNVTMTIAEKVIQTSIQSSGDIIKRMILAATDKMKKKQWAKIYVTKSNTGVSMNVDSEFMEALSHLSDNIKIITMDNGEEGTCIIELPDEIVDASVSTQLENIKDILNNARV